MNVPPKTKPAAGRTAVTVYVGQTLKDAEKALIAATLQQTSYNVQASARLLGIDRSTLYDKMKVYGLER